MWQNTGDGEGDIVWEDGGKGAVVLENKSSCKHGMHSWEDELEVDDEGAGWAAMLLMATTVIKVAT